MDDGDEEEEEGSEAGSAEHREESEKEDLGEGLLEEGGVMALRIVVAASLSLLSPTTPSEITSSVSGSSLSATMGPRSFFPSLSLSAVAVAVLAALSDRRRSLLSVLTSRNSCEGCLSEVLGAACGILADSGGASALRLEPAVGKSSLHILR
jgi:hypothetical protein